MYVFLMPQGKLVEIDNQNLQERVLSLKAYLAKYHDLPHDRQVLFINGGDELHEDNLLKEHSAGDDPTNPIFVFLRNNDIKPEAYPFKGFDLLRKLEELIASPSGPSLSAVRPCLQDLYKASSDSFYVVERLLTEQRRMCEGWFIVLVHFDQLMKASRASLEDYWKDYDKFCGEVSHWEANLKKFASIKKRLRSVPLLPSLLPISAELTTEAVELHGPPRTLYDWVCLHFLHLKAPRRPNVFPLAGTIGSSLNLAGSRAGSEVGLAARAALVTSGKTSMSPICNANSFYLSTSSPSSQTATPPVVPSLETALLEYIEDTAFRLSQVREAVGGPRRCPSSSSNGEDGNSILLSEDEDDEEQEEVESHGAHLATVYSRLKTFGELLDSAPSDTESHEAEAPPSTPSLVIPSSSYIAPFDSSECVHVGRCFTSDDAVDMRGGDVGVAASSDGRKLSWRHSRKHFSCHLNQLQKLQDQATHDQNCLQRLSEQLFLDWQRRESKYSQRHFREVLKNQEHMLSAIGTRFQGLKKTFDDVTGLKFKLAESISTLQEQIQAFSSEIHLKHRQCLRCFKDLESISTCSALLDQLRDTPELYIKCLLEIVRRRRVTDVWISINDQYSKRLAAFQRDESSRRETISRELKGHILQQIFSPLRSPRFPVATCLAPGGIRQYSRLSLVLPTPSTKRLNRGNKCLSASYLNFTPQCSSPFRLPSNRPAQAATVASARRIPQSSLDRQVDPLERSLEGLPSVSEEDLRELMPQLPEDLAHMIAVVLEEVATEGDALAFYLDAMTRGPTRRPRLLSSPCLLLRPQSPTQSPTSSSKSRCISVATSTEDGKRYFSSAERLSSIFERPPPPPPTEDKAVSVALEAASLDLSVCDSPDPRPASPPSNAAPFMSLFPPPPHSEQSSHSSLMEPSSDIYLSMDASAFESDQSADANISPPHQPLQSDTRFHSFDGSSSNESSLVAPNPHFDEALTSQRDLLKRLYADLSRILPGRFAALTLTSSPKFKPVEKSESYLGVALSTIREVLGYLEDSDAAFQTPAASTNVETPSSTSTASVQASCALVDSSTECRPSELLAQQISFTRALTHITETSQSEDLATTSTAYQLRLARHKCVFSNFHQEDVVLFIPVYVADKCRLQASDDNSSSGGGDGGGVDASPTHNAGVCGSRSLAMLSSAIISSTMAAGTAVDAMATSAAADAGASQPPEQWRMLSNDGHVYFLHDLDFEAFGVARLAHLQAIHPHRAQPSHTAGGTTHPRLSTF